MMKNLKFQKGPTASNLHECGFTFIELVLYISIVTLVLTAIVPFGWNIVTSSTKSSVQQEVYSQARFVSQRIKYEIRNARGIDSVSPTSISLDVATAANDPTIIDLSDGKIRIKLGAASIANLNSDKTNVTSLLFTNYSSLDNKTKHIEFSFTIKSNYSGQRKEYIETQTIQSSAELRSN